MQMEQQHHLSVVLIGFIFLLTATQKSLLGAAMFHFITAIIYTLIKQLMTGCMHKTIGEAEIKKTIIRW